MKLKEVFNQLTYGELSQISIGGGASGEINEANYPAIMSHINLGLTALYKRFLLKEGRLNVLRVLGMQTYVLHSRYSELSSKSKESVRYLLDTYEERFLDDILKIERVYVLGRELPLNDESDPISVHTPSFNVLRLPILLDPKIPQVEVVYRANHPLIDPDKGAFDPERIDIELPYTHLEPLLLFVASRMNNPMGMSNEFHAGNSYAKKYEEACAQIEMTNLRVDPKSQQDKLRERGWV